MKIRPILASAGAAALAAAAFAPAVTSPTTTDEPGDGLARVFAAGEVDLDSDVSAGDTTDAGVPFGTTVPAVAQDGPAGGSDEASPELCAGPSSGDNAEVDPLCGTTVIRGDQSAQTRVRLPVDVMIEANFAAEDAQIRIEGDGDYVGFALSEVVSGRTGNTVLAVRGPGHWFGEADPSVDQRLFHFAPEDGEDVVAARSTGEAMLPAGVYDLYLIAEGEPVTVTVALPGVDGEAEIHPATPADVRSFSGSTPSGVVTDSLTSPGIFQWVTWVWDTEAPWTSAHALRRDAEYAGHAASAGRPPGFGVRATHTFWSAPSEWSAAWSLAHRPSGRGMAHGLWLGLGDVAESQASGSSVQTAGASGMSEAWSAEVERVRQVGNFGIPRARTPEP